MCLIFFQRNELSVCLFWTFMLISNNFSRILPNVFNSKPINNDFCSKYVNMKTFFSSKIEPIVICYSSDKKNIIVIFIIKIKPIKSKKRYYTNLGSFKLKKHLCINLGPVCLINSFKNPGLYV